MPFCPQARSVPEDCESADALKAVADDIAAQTLIVMSVDLITDVCLEVSFSHAWIPQGLSHSTMQKYQATAPSIGRAYRVMPTLLTEIRM